MLLAFVAGAERASAIPGLQDLWRLACTAGIDKGVSEKDVAKARAKADSGSGEEGAIGALNYACVQSAWEIKKFELATTKWQEAGGKGAAPVKNAAGSTAALKSAVARLGGVYKAKKGDPKVTYYRGLGLALIGDVEAVNRLDEVITDSAASSYSADAILVMAEFNAEAKGLPAAMDYYKKALASKKPFARNYANYKLGWFDYVGGAQKNNAGAKKAAMSKLAGIAKTVQKGKGLDAALYEALKRDLLAMCVDYGDAAEAKNILKGAGAGDVYGGYLETLAYTKWEGGKQGEAYKLFGMALKEQPKGKNNLQISLNLAQISAQLQNLPLIASNMKQIIKTYLDEKAPYRKGKKKPELKKIDAQIEQTTFDYATGIDQAARKDNKPASFALADDMYKLFEKTFPKSAKGPEIRFYHGQILFTMKKFTEAAATLVELVKANPRGKFTKDALDIMISAAQTANDADKTKYDIPKPGSGKKEMKIPAVKQTFADSCDTFLKYGAKNDNTPLMKYLAASVYYDFGHYKDGNKRYLDYIAQHPQHELVKTAAARVLEYYKQQNDGEPYTKVKTKLLGNPMVKAAPELQAYFAEKPKKGKDKDAEKELAGEDDGSGDKKDKKDKKKKKKKKKKGDDEEGAGEDGGDAKVEDVGEEIPE